MSFTESISSINNICSDVTRAISLVYDIASTRRNDASWYLIEAVVPEFRMALVDQ